MTARRRRLRAVVLLAVGAVMSLLALAVSLADPLHQLELDTVDARLAVRGPQPPPGDIVVVRIDEATFERLGVRWPFPRSMHARVIDALRRAGAKVIVYDVQFTEPSSAAEDGALMAAVKRARGRIVLATSEVDERGGHDVFGGEDVVRRLGARVGNASLPLDPDGVTRRFAVAVDGMPGLAVAAAETAGDRPIPRDALPGEKPWIDFRGPPGAISRLSFADVYQHRVPARAVRGKIVLVGASAPSLQDVRPTSASADRLMSGVEIHANAVSTLGRGTPLREPPGWVAAGLVLLLGMVVPAAAVRAARPRRRVLVALMLLTWLAGALYLVALQFAFSAGLIVPCVYPLVALALSGVAVLAVESTNALAERERVRELFIRYVPERVVDDVLKTADDDFCLAGEIRQGTVLVCDIRDFTTFGESRPAEDVIHVLNRFLGDMAQAILDHGGTLLGYRGDGIFAVFGAPLEQADHADRALAAAREMAGPRLERFNEWLEEHALGRPFRIGIGVNSGRIVSGHVGCDVRVEYTAIGDPVNTAFRLEEMTKRMPHDVLISGTTQAMLRGPAPGLRYVDSMVIRGKMVEVGLWTLAPGDPPPPRRFEAGRPARPITRI